MSDPKVLAAKSADRFDEGGFERRSAVVPFLPGIRPSLRKVG